VASDVGSTDISPMPMWCSLEGLVEPFDLAAGGGVVGAGVLLDDVQAAQLGSEGGDQTGL